MKRLPEDSNEIRSGQCEGQGEISLTTPQKRELDRRKREHLRDPSAAKPWREVKERLENRRK